MGSGNRDAFGFVLNSEGGCYRCSMSLVEVVNDLLALEELAEHEDDPQRRRALELVRGHLADREPGGEGLRGSEGTRPLAADDQGVDRGRHARNDRRHVACSCQRPLAG